MPPRLTAMRGIFRACSEQPMSDDYLEEQARGYYLIQEPEFGHSFSRMGTTVHAAARQTDCNENM